MVATSLEDLTTEDFREFAHQAVTEFSTRKLDEEQWDTFASRLHYVPQSAGPEALAKAVAEAEAELGDDVRRLHYLSVPPKRGARGGHDAATTRSSSSAPGW